jgi:hypothetical protein
MGMYEDVLRFWMDREKEGTTRDASRQVVQHLKIHGATRPPTGSAVPDVNTRVVVEAHGGCCGSSIAQ